MYDCLTLSWQIPGLVHDERSVTIDPGKESLFSGIKLTSVGSSQEDWTVALALCSSTQNPPLSHLDREDLTRSI